MHWRRQLTWNPHDLGWRIAVLFMVGSFLFALGSFPPYSAWVDGRIVGITFVIGSLFFTTAGYGAFTQVINDGRDASAPFLRWAWSPRTRLWWAAFIQLIGTLLFNANTMFAMVQSFTVEETNRLVWAPDFFGCIAFLFASHVYWITTCGSLWCTRTDDADWWSSLVNYVGSIAFMASAIGAFTLPTTGETVNIAIVNSGTFIGALCFLVGAYVLLPASERNPSR